jgi:uncharacterized protein YhfF
VTHSREPNIDRYWAQFLESLPASARPAQYYDVFSFGTTKENAKSIAALVLDGVKTATGSLQWVYEAEGRQPPKQDDYSIVTDGEGHPLCVILDTEVRIVPYDEVDGAFAWDGGEEDRSLESWRQIYWDYIVLECARIQREPALKTPLVCERFRVVYRDPPKPNGIAMAGP